MDARPLTADARAAAPPRRLAPFERPLLWQFALGLAVVIGALVVCWAIHSEQTPSAPLLVVFSALLPVALMLRLAPFLVAASTGFVATWLLFIQPRMSLAIESDADALRLALLFFALSGTVLTAWVSERNRARRKADRMALSELEERLARRNAQFEELLDEAPVGVYLVDADFVIRRVNPIAQSILGRVPGGAVGRDFGEAIHLIGLPEEFADEVEHIFRRVLETGEPYDTTELAALSTPEGVVEHFQWGVDQIGFPDGRDGLVCYFREVSDQVRIQEAIVQTEKRYQTLFESIDEGFCIIEVLFDERNRPRDYRFIEVNPAFERQSGMRGARGRTMRELVPDHESHWFEAFGRVATTGEPVRFVDHAKGLGRWFEVDAFRVDEPEHARVAVLFTDITRRKEAEDALEKELRDNQRVHEISCRLIPTDDIGTLYKELIDAAIELSDADRGTIQSLDQEAQELVMLETKGMPDGTRERITRIPLSAQTTCAFAAKTGTRVLLDFEHEALVNDSAEARAHLELGIRTAMSTPLVTRSGRTAGILTTHWNRTWEPSARSLYLLDILARQAADLIERVQGEAALREADRRKDEFLATLAHELRNPLAAIRTAVHVMRSEDPEPARLGEMSTIIDRQSTQLVRLIDDLLDVSRISRGKVQLAKEPVDLAAIVRQAVEDSRQSCEERGLDPVLGIRDETLPVDGDPVRLTQVVSNLLHNACKFSPPGGKIRVTLENDHDHAVVRVADEGIGMPPEQIEHVFEMFTQFEVPSQGEGLGIGLALTRAIVELHDGEIVAHSDGLGRGSEFVVRLPATAAPVAAEALTPRPPTVNETPTPTGPRRIVAADDNHDALASLTLLLRLHGHEVHTASDGFVALEQVRVHAPDVVLLDIGMPEMDGYEVARRIRAEPGGRGVLLVAMTGWGQDRDRERARDAGFDVHLTKPVEPGLLAQHLERGRTADMDPQPSL